MASANNSIAAKIVIAFTGLCLLVIFATSFVYRLTNPSMAVRVEQKAPMQKSEGMDRIQHLMEDLAKDPQNTEIMLAVADAFMRMGAWDKAESLLNRALGIEKDNLHALMMLASCQFNHEHYPEAAETLRRAIEVDPENPWAYYNLGLVLKYRLKDEAGAKAHFQKAIDFAHEQDADLKQRAEHELGKH